MPKKSPLLKLAARYQNSPIVIWQIGAYNGLDDVGRSVLHHPLWHYHFFEPNPYAFRQVVKNRTEANVHNYEVAVSDVDSERIRFYLPRDSDKPFGKRVAGLTKTAMDFHGIDADPCIVENWHYKYLQERTNSSPWILRIDMEGSDFRIFGLVKEQRPIIFQYEHAHLYDPAKAQNYLKNIGYSMKHRDGLDEIWVRDIWF